MKLMIPSPAVAYRHWCEMIRAGCSETQLSKRPIVTWAQLLCGYLLNVASSLIQQHVPRSRRSR